MLISNSKLTLKVCYCLNVLGPNAHQTLWLHQGLIQYNVEHVRWKHVRCVKPYGTQSSRVRHFKNSAGFMLLQVMHAKSVSFLSERQGGKIILVLFSAHIANINFVLFVDFHQQTLFIVITILSDY